MILTKKINGNIPTIPAQYQCMMNRLIAHAHAISMNGRRADAIRGATSPSGRNAIKIEFVDRGYVQCQ